MTGDTISWSLGVSDGHKYGNISSAGGKYGNKTVPTLNLSSSKTFQLIYSLAREDFQFSPQSLWIFSFLSDNRRNSSLNLTIAGRSSILLFKSDIIMFHTLPLLPHEPVLLGVKRYTRVQSPSEEISVESNLNLVKISSQKESLLLRERD